MSEITKEEAAAALKQVEQETVERAARKIQAILDEEGCYLEPIFLIEAGSIKSDIHIKVR